MTFFYKIMVGVSLVLLFSTAICGWYIHANKGILTDYAGSVNFHMVSAVLSLLSVSITLLMKGKG